MSELAEVLTAHGVYAADDRAKAIISEVRPKAKGKTPKDVADAARLCIERLEAMGRGAGEITPGLILAALGAGRRTAEAPRPDACLGCVGGVVYLMAWRDGLVSAFACDCDAGRARTPPLTPALQVADNGTHADAHPVRLVCYDFARGRSDDSERRRMVDDLFGALRPYRPGPVLAVLRRVGQGEWVEIADLVARVETRQVEADGRRAA